MESSLRSSRISRSVLRMSSTTRICSSDAFSATAVARTASTTACRAGSVATRASSLAIRALSAVSRCLPFLSKGFERLAMMITNLTRFLSESPELFRLSPASLRGGAVFRSFTDHVVITAFVHAITCCQSTGHERTRDVLNRTGCALRQSNRAQLIRQFDSVSGSAQRAFSPLAYALGDRRSPPCDD